MQNTEESEFGPLAQDYLDRANQYAHALLNESARAIEKANGGPIDTRAVLNLATALVGRAHIRTIEIMGEMDNDTNPGPTKPDQQKPT